MNDVRRRGVFQACELHRRGIYSTEEMCKNILFFCIEPPFADQYLQLLTDEVRLAIAEYLPKLPSTDEEWAEFEGISQLDGNEFTWSELIAECRAGTEAARVLLLGSAPSPPSADFMERVRAARRSRLAKFFDAGRDIGDA